MIKEAAMKKWVNRIMAGLGMGAMTLPAAYYGWTGKAKKPGHTMVPKPPQPQLQHAGYHDYGPGIFGR